MSPLRNSSDCISQAAPTNQNNFVSKSITPGETNAGTSGSLACEQAIRERWTSLTNINYNNSLTLPNSTSERYSSDPILLLENELITLAMCDDELPPPFVPNEPWPGVNVLTHQSNHDNEKHKNQNGADEHGHNQNSNHQEDLPLLWELPEIEFLKDLVLNYNYDLPIEKHEISIPKRLPLYKRKPPKHNNRQFKQTKRRTDSGNKF
ncbi:hypothetical protein EVAR_24300_1 [Eumeta japonica]|uniref:Uncharacterized protein n=1 Tax=Eumeta variegata TaxID=151549 RepID=A0A4C1VLC8_EUMVA|nr:hypothetical protein EVAR_24300_1 [Eumeta japonica]